MSKYFAGADECVPLKKPKGKELSKTKRNKTTFQKKDKVENVFAHTKNWTRISGRYDGTAQEFNDVHNAILYSITCARCLKMEPTRTGRINYPDEGIKTYGGTLCRLLIYQTKTQMHKTAHDFWKITTFVSL